MKSTSLASRLSGYSVDGRKHFVKDRSHFQSASVDGPLLESIIISSQVSDFTSSVSQLVLLFILDPALPRQVPKEMLDGEDGKRVSLMK